MAKKYRAELSEHDVATRCFDRLIERHGLICLIGEFILYETGIGDGDIPGGFSFPNIYQPWEKETDPYYFETGVRFNYTPDCWLDMLTYEEFVWLIEDACESYLQKNHRDAEIVAILLEQVRDKFLNREGK